MKKFDGIFTALVTPFLKGEVDYNSLKKLVRFQLDQKINGLVISGTTGESPTLSSPEKEKIFSFIKSEVAGQVPLVVGTGSNSTSSSVEASRAAEKWGADAVLVVTPYYNKPPQRGLVEHFKKVAESVALPVILYNVPTRTITAISLETIQTLSRVKNIIGIKEASGDIELGRQIHKSCGPEFLLTSGDDGTWLELCQNGARGTISVLSNIAPRQMVSQLDRLHKKDSAVLSEAKKFNELIRLLFVEANPIPVKAALQMMGVIQSDELRLPLVRLAEEHRKPLQQELEKMGMTN